MDLNTSELKQLEAVLLQAFTSYDDFEHLAQLYLGTNMPEISPPLALRNVIKNLFDWADANGKWLLLVEQAPLCVPNNKTLRSVCRNIRDKLLAVAQNQVIAHAGGGPPAGLVETTLLANHQPFMNRHEVRKGVRSMADENGIRILAVYGAAKSGKSYIHDFLMFLQSSRWLQADCSLSRVGEDFSIDVSVGELTEHIIMQFDPGATVPEKRPTETPEKWADRSAEWLRHQFRSRHANPCWIILDGFDNRLVNSATLDLIRGLAKRVLRDLHHVRLVLLGAPDSLLGLHQFLSIDCEVKVLDETHWLDFFKDIAERYQLAKEKSGLVEQWVEEVRLGVPAQAPDRFRVIADFCRRIVVRQFATT